jgi:hypothetical protein
MDGISSADDASKIYDQTHRECPKRRLQHQDYDELTNTTLSRGLDLSLQILSQQIHLEKIDLHRVYRVSKVTLEPLTNNQFRATNSKIFLKSQTMGNHGTESHGSFEDSRVANS